MTYTWGYLKENTLSKLNLGEEEANQQGFLSRFPYYANEAMTQICSAIKPNEKYFIVEIYDKLETWRRLVREFGLNYTDICQEELNYSTDEEYENKKAFWNKWTSLSFTDEPITLPDDFISFSDDIAEFKALPIIIAGQIVNTPYFVEIGDDVLQYYGYNQVICKQIGTYRIPYKARWFFFTKDLANHVVITAPSDVCDAIPSYIVSQCYKIDDETKASIYRNEYELFLARIDDTNFKSQRTFTIGGNW